MLRKKCVIIDYGLGNVFSVMSTIKQIGHSPELSSNPKKIMNADRVILPGVGAYGRASEKLKIDGLDKVIIDYISTGKPLLGICVGMQLLMERGEEFGNYKGFSTVSNFYNFIETINGLSLKKTDNSIFEKPIIEQPNNPEIESPTEEDNELYEHNLREYQQKFRPDYKKKELNAGEFTNNNSSDPNDLDFIMTNETYLCSGSNKYYYEFDIEVKNNMSGRYFGQGTAVLNINPAIFGNTPENDGRVSVTKGNLFSPPE